MESSEECPICLEEYSRELCILKDGNANQKIISKCQHWFCVKCLIQMTQSEIALCPLCRVDISELLNTYRQHAFQFQNAEEREEEENENDVNDAQNEDREPDVLNIIVNNIL